MIGIAPSLTTVRTYPSFTAKGTRVFPIYTPRQTQCAYVTTNLQNEEKFGNASAMFLGVTQSDSNIEFLADATSQLPLGVRDQRYCDGTSQPYAASSYGVSQVLPDSWNTFAPIFNPYLNISNSSTPIFALLTEDGKRIGTLLAAARHFSTRISQNFSGFGQNRQDFEIKWSKVIHQYNAGKGAHGYAFHPDGRIGVVTQGSACFEPGVTSPSGCGNPAP